MYTIFLVLHVLTAGIWMALFPTVMILNGLRKKAANTSSELPYMKAISVLGLVLGNVGAIGVLISGPALAGIGKYPWFDFATMPWLAWKQVIFFLALILSFAVIVPRSKKVRKLLTELLDAKRANIGASDELRSTFDSYVTASLIVNLLVLINMILGEWKPV